MTNDLRLEGSEGDGAMTYIDGQIFATTTQLRNASSHRPK